MLKKKKANTRVNLESKKSYKLKNTKSKHIAGNITEDKYKGMTNEQVNESYRELLNN
jgi:hypothetical protein